MKRTYGESKICEHCGTEFITEPRKIRFCSQGCKNPINRPGHIPWNTGIKLNDEQKAKQNINGLKTMWGWRLGTKFPEQSERWRKNNPNKDGRVNNQRPKKYVDSEFDAYKRKCKYWTYRSRIELRNSGEEPMNIGKYKHQFQLDHIIPFKQGFDLHIDPIIIGSKFNLRFILGEENRKKWDCYQTEEVVQKIMEASHGLLN